MHFTVCPASTRSQRLMFQSSARISVHFTHLRDDDPPQIAAVSILSEDFRAFHQAETRQQYDQVLVSILSEDFRAFHPT